MTEGLPAVIEAEIIEGEIVEVEPGASSSRALVAQADTDRQLIELWLGKHASRHTRRNYIRHVERFLAFVRKPLAEIRLGDLQRFATSLEAEGQASATRANAVSALKSLFPSRRRPAISASMSAQP